MITLGWSRAGAVSYFGLAALLERYRAYADVWVYRVGPFDYRDMVRQCSTIYYTLIKPVECSIRFKEMD